MGTKLSPHHVALIYDAALASFWRKGALRKFLRGCGVSESFLATWAEDESKRDLLDRLFAKLGEADKGDAVLARMSSSLREQTTFPDLNAWEDSEEKLRAARQAVDALQHFETTREEERATAAERQASQARYRERQQAAQRAKVDLEKLKSRLDALAMELGSQEAGYTFQDWFYDLVAFFEMTARRPYVTGGRQIDGSITHDGTTYLVELKFTTEQAGAPEIDIFLKKVNDKADNTMGIFVSISGYSSVAIEGASGRRTPLLLLDHAHLYAALTGAMTLPTILERVRRHASQTSEAYLPISAFGSG